MSDRSTPGDILLDAGTNELETLVFQLGEGWFGVNVAKVREVIRWVEPKAAPHMHSSVLGMFNMRGSVIPLVDLSLHLDLRDRETAVERENQRIIITEFNGLQTGFVVDGVEQIYRLSWERIRPAPDLKDLGSSPGDDVIQTCTGIVDLDDRLVLMLDFESVADAILLQEKLHIDEVENPNQVDRSTKKVVIAEDSPFMRNLIIDVMRKSGYEQAEIHADGASAWEAIKRHVAAGTTIDAIVSDIEMPQMDGLHLTRKIRETDALTETPVVLFSSLISKDNLKKGQQVGATAQLQKPELRDMVLIVDRAVTGQLKAQAQQAA